MVLNFEYKKNDYPGNFSNDIHPRRLPFLGRDYREYSRTAIDYQDQNSEEIGNNDTVRKQHHNIPSTNVKHNPYHFFTQIFFLYPA